MAASRIVEVRRAVIEGIAAQALMTDVLVTYGWNPEATDREQVFTMRARGNTPPASLRSGRTHRNEDASFVVVVHVELVGGNNEDADDRALELGAAVEEWVADHRTNHGVDGVHWIQVDGWELTGGSKTGAYVAQLMYTVSYSARLT